MTASRKLELIVPLLACRYDAQDGGRRARIKRMEMTMSDLETLILTINTAEADKAPHINDEVAMVCGSPFGIRV